MTWWQQVRLSLCDASGRTIWYSARAVRSRLFVSVRFVYRLQGVSASKPDHVLPSGTPFPKEARLHGLSGKLQVGRLGPYLCFIRATKKVAGSSKPRPLLIT